MTTAAPISPIGRILPPHRLSGVDKDVPTESLAGGAGRPVDPLELVDYRTQRHLLAASGAPPGRYLGIESRTGMWLFPLTESAAHLGRGMGAHLRIDDCHVSRLHATVVHEGDGARLLDGRSLNGTWVNGEQVSSTVLCHGDLIEIGRLPLRYLELTDG